MSAQQFTDEQQTLHDEVKDLIRTAARNKGGRKSSGDSSVRAVRKAYTPEHDLQILTLLKEDERAEKFGSSSTEEKKELCAEMCGILESAHDQKRTPDSLYYRITKLLRASRLDEINYRIKGEGPSKPAKKKKRKDVIPEPEDAVAEDESSDASGETQEAEQTEAEAPESSQDESSDTEDFDDDDDFLE